MSESKNLRKLCIVWPGQKNPTTMETMNCDDLVRWRKRAGIRLADAVTESSFDRVLVFRCIHRVDDIFAFMDDLHYFMKPGGIVALDGPYGSHDQADEDLLAKRRIFKDTFRAFEPNWQFRARTFYIDATLFNDQHEPAQVGLAVANLRNVCKGFTAELMCQKPVPDGYKAGDPATAFKYI